MKKLLLEGGAAGHMAHPYDLDYVRSGQDLIDFFSIMVPAYLETNEPHVKTDGINVSFKLIDRKTIDGTKKEFAVDRGSKKTIDIEGITVDRIGERFAEGHGMREAITRLLTILNDVLATGVIDEDLMKLGLWDDPNIFFNTEYVMEKDDKPMNVVKYDENFIAIHGVNTFFEAPSPSGRTIQRKSKEVPLGVRNQQVLQNLSDKLVF